MNEQKHNHHGYGGQNNDSVHYGHSSYWKRAHRDWRFWVGVISMLAAIIIYVMSDDLAGGLAINGSRPFQAMLEPAELHNPGILKNEDSKDYRH